MVENEDDIQSLEAVDFHAKTIQDSGAPVKIQLIIEVIHNETGHGWTQKLELSEPRFVDFLRLLAYAAKAEGIRWKQ